MAKKQLTSIEHGAFDTAALQHELAQALEDDRIYKLTDDMKKRAIHTAGSYDEFKNLVACADLKPISQRELSNFSKAERQTNISYKKQKPQKKEKKRFEPAAPALDVPPASAVDFCRNWKRYLKTTDAKFRYLQMTTAERLGEMFRQDIDSDLVAEIVEVLVVSWKLEELNPEEPAPAAFPLSTMEALSQTARFSLILDFFDDQQLEMVRKLFDLVESADNLADDNQKRLTSLKKTFRLG